MELRPVESVTEAVVVDQAAPNFCLSATTGEVCLEGLQGTVLVLYFYPRDNTPGCTTEACDFRDDMAALTELDATVWGISTDSLPSHQKFTAKYQLPFALLSDPEAVVCRQYGVWKEKRLYGKTNWGVERSTFVIDREGVVRRIWRKVKVAGHVSEVKAFVETLPRP